jgi:hypothetical protein
VSSDMTSGIGTGSAYAGSSSIGVLFGFVCSFDGTISERASSIENITAWNTTILVSHPDGGSGIGRARGESGGISSKSWAQELRYVHGSLER